MGTTGPDSQSDCAAPNSEGSDSAAWRLHIGTKLGNVGTDIGRVLTYSTSPGKYLPVM
jgi:hypothetical protein